ncbi:putative mMPL domain protein [Mycobacterium avium subsp. avium 2285 (R)]|nr:putative mMPL domain protein [Mycobacterium avium subsp. avium 2285 (R)]
MGTRGRRRDRSAFLAAGRGRGAGRRRRDGSGRPNTAAGQAPQSLPQHSPSARITALAGQFPGGDRTPLIVVVSRADGAVLGPPISARPGRPVTAPRPPRNPAPHRRSR